MTKRLGQLHREAVPLDSGHTSIEDREALIVQLSQGSGEHRLRSQCRRDSAKPRGDRPHRARLRDRRRVAQRAAEDVETVVDLHGELCEPHSRRGKPVQLALERVRLALELGEARGELGNSFLLGGELPALRFELGARRCELTVDSVHGPFLVVHGALESGDVDRQDGSGDNRGEDKQRECLSDNKTSIFEQTGQQSGSSRTPTRRPVLIFLLSRSLSLARDNAPWADERLLSPVWMSAWRMAI